MTDVVDDTPSPGPRSRIRRFGVLAVVASFVGIWGYVLYLSIFVGRADPADHLDDANWVEAAEATCAPTAAAVERMPYASELRSIEDREAALTARADALDAVTDELERMVSRLRGLVPPSDPEEARAVGRWLNDWEVLIQDRREYADAFRAGEDEPFTVTDRGGYQIDVLLDEFAAKSNDMPSCAPPNDVG